MKKISSLEDHLGYWLRCLSNLVSDTFAERMEKHGVSVAQWVVLRTLYDHEAVSLSILADEVGIDKSSMSRMIERLINKNLVIQLTNKSDKRAMLLDLSEKGKKIVPVLAHEADVNDAQFFSSLTADQKHHLLHQIQLLLTIGNK